MLEPLNLRHLYPLIFEMWNPPYCRCQHIEKSKCTLNASQELILNECQASIQWLGKYVYFVVVFIFGSDILIKIENVWIGLISIISILYRFHIPKYLIFISINSNGEEVDFVTLQEQHLLKAFYWLTRPIDRQRIKCANIF